MYHESVLAFSYIRLLQAVYALGKKSQTEVGPIRCEQSDMSEAKK